ncbi:MAG: hypothetical protein BMS9Abin29_1713 [Gemmatimonadota bacterium]|nr:MAG: hypothetical protein BMS9Abin29_1713 [Gemmatimonadota bacterium]
MPTMMGAERHPGQQTGGTLAAVAVALLLAACAGGPSPSSSGPVASDSQWAALERPRVERLADAPRVTVAEMILFEDAWVHGGDVSAALGLQELISAGLLRRADIDFVERRRFAEAVDRRRRGLPPRRNAPPIGTSRGAEFVLTGSWIPAGDSAALDLRLVETESGGIVRSWRTLTPRQADPTSLARLVVGTTIESLRDLGRLPAWTDPLAADVIPAPATYVASRVNLEAAAAFVAGLAAEDRYDWERARRGYQSAIEIAGPAFFEADEALARVARLRAGGTLGGSEP